MSGRLKGEHFREVCLIFPSFVKDSLDLLSDAIDIAFDGTGSGIFVSSAFKSGGDEGDIEVSSGSEAQSEESIFELCEEDADFYAADTAGIIDKSIGHCTRAAPTSPPLSPVKAGTDERMCPPSTVSRRCWPRWTNGCVLRLPAFASFSCFASFRTL